jgi:general L-amino acid transport system permease protein
MNSSSLSRFWIRKGVPVWRDVEVLKWIAQILSAALIIGGLYFFFHNVLVAANERGLSFGYGFLKGAAGFPIAESIIPYDPSRSFGYAIWIGFLNTLKVSLVGIVLATILGFFVAIARLSSNWLVSNIAGLYVNIIRNIPLLVQLFIWYFGVFQQLPPVNQAFTLPGPIYLSQRGLYTIGLAPTSSFGFWFIFLVVGLVLAFLIYRWLFNFQVRTGHVVYPLLIAALVFLFIAVLGWFLAGSSPLQETRPVLGRFNFTGGLKLTPEFAALLTGLVIYTAAFISEVMRGGILSVSKGHIEAAKALGLSQTQTLRLVTIPLALRVIIPPLISQYLNLTKNSSLAVAIGFVDLFFVGRTIINQAGQAVPVFILIMAIYLGMSLVTSAILNFYNKRVQLVER